MAKKLKDLFKQKSSAAKQRPKRKKGHRPDHATVIVPDGKVTIKPIVTETKDDQKDGK